MLRLEKFMLSCSMLAVVFSWFNRCDCFRFLGEHISTMEQLTKDALESAADSLSAHPGDRVTIRIREPNVRAVNVRHGSH